MILVVGVGLSLTIAIMALAVIAREWPVFRMSAGVAAFLTVVLLALVSLTP